MEYLDPGVWPSFSVLRLEKYSKFRGVVPIPNIDGGYAVLTELNEIIGFSEQDQEIWRHAAKTIELTQATGSHAMAWLGPKLAAIGSYKGRGAVMLIDGIPSKQGKTLEYQYAELPSLDSITATKDDTFLVSATKDKNVWLAVLSTEGAMLSKRDLAESFPSGEYDHFIDSRVLSSMDGTIYTFASFAPKSGVFGECVLVSAWSKDFVPLWHRRVCEVGAELRPTSLLVDHEKNVYVAGGMERWIPYEAQSLNGPFTTYHRVLFSFDSKGLERFRFEASEKSPHGWPWSRYTQLVFNPVKKEIIATGSAPYQGVVEVFNTSGQVTWRGYSSGSHHNEEFEGAILLPDGSGVKAVGIAGKYIKYVDAFVRYKGATSYIPFR